MPQLSRRSLLGLAGAAGVAATAGVLERHSASAEQPATHPFFGRHQSGILTPQQDHLHVAALDLTTTHKGALVSLMRAWTAAVERMTSGKQIGGGALPAVDVAPPDDTGEALGLTAGRLTVTVGVGGSLLDKVGIARPATLKDLPRFAGDALREVISGGDLVVQACADDPQVAVHAIRNLVRLAHGTAAVRWSQLGFGRTSSTSKAQQTPRNLFGFKDGTSNAVSDVFVRPAEGPTWLVDGSYLVVRRIAMTIERWDRTSLQEQEQTIGRHKGTGAPLGLSSERDPLTPRELPMHSHVRQAHPSVNGGAELLRRGYSFVDGSDGLGHLDAGLFFMAYMRDPKSFVTVQTNLAANDALNEYVTHTGSALFAVLPGVQRGGWLGHGLLG
ncbi:MAG: deferrochelatase/peroxidase EfeB [Frankiales bacterium]|nr:deferrochelatase/peroxidase EfeB [Frankiales bacterium]